MREPSGENAATESLAEADELVLTSAYSLTQMVNFVASEYGIDPNELTERLVGHGFVARAEDAGVGETAGLAEEDTTQQWQAVVERLNPFPEDKLGELIVRYDGLKPEFEFPIPAHKGIPTRTFNVFIRPLGGDSTLKDAAAHLKRHGKKIKLGKESTKFARILIASSEINAAAREAGTEL